MAGTSAVPMGLAALLTWVERATAPMLWKAISGAASVTLERERTGDPGAGRTAAAEAVPSCWWWICIWNGGGIQPSSWPPLRWGLIIGRRDPALWRKRRLVPVGHLDGGHIR